MPSNEETLAEFTGDLTEGDATIDGGFLNRMVLTSPRGLGNNESSQFRWEVRVAAGEESGFGYTAFAVQKLEHPRSI